MNTQAADKLDSVPTGEPREARPTFYKIRKEFRPTWRAGVGTTEIIAEGVVEGDYIRAFGWGLFRDGRGVYPLGSNYAITEATTEEVEAEFKRMGVTRQTEQWCTCPHSAEGHDASGRCMESGCWCDELRLPTEIEPN